MIRCLALTLTCSALLAAAPASAQSPDPADSTPLVAAPIDLDALGDWGTRTFRYMRRDDAAVRQVGEVVLTTSVNDLVVTFRDAWSVQLDGRTIDWRMKADCDKVGLMRPMRIVTRGAEADELMTYRLQLRGNQAVIRPIPGEQRSQQMPPDTVTDAALYRIIPLLDRDPGKRWNIDHLWELSELNLKPGGTITCEGEETIPLHGEDHTLWRYAYRLDDRLVAEFWVDPDRPHLRQFVLDRRKLFVETDAPD